MSPLTAQAKNEFETLTLPHVNELFSVALRYTRNDRDAEDLVQDTYMRAFGAWERFIPGSNVRAWMFRILTNSFISGYRTRRKQRRLAEPELYDDAVGAFFSSHARDFAADPEREWLSGSMGDEVSRALDSLPPAWRVVVTLADLEGMSYRQIADIIGIPVGTVMSRLFRARRHLEVALADFAAREHGYRRKAPVADEVAVRRERRTRKPAAARQEGGRRAA